jgi:archaellum component FlaC
MNTADTLLLPIAGFIIITLLTVLGWVGRKWLSSFENTINKIYVGFTNISKKLDAIKDEIENLKLENKLTSNYIHEIETRMEDRLGNISGQIMENRSRISTLEKRTTDVERIIEKVKVLHERNHKEII